MRGRRALLIIVIVLLNVVVLGYLYLTMSRPNQVDEILVEATPTPVPFVGVVVSAQDPIPRGWRFRTGDGATTVKQWPVDELPPGYFSSQVQLENLYVTEDIPKDAPIIRSMLDDKPVAPFPEGRVGYGLPVDVQGGVGWHIREGDHVDVLAAIKLIDVDVEFQSPMPNRFQTLPEVVGEDAALSSISGVYGRFESLPDGTAAIILPGSDPIPQIVVQMTVQDAIVWRIGANFGEPAIAAPTPEAEEAGGGLFGQQQQPAPAAAAAPATAQRGDVELMVLLVTPQDALILKYLHEIGADLDLVLRAPGDSTFWITGAVWSRYILDRYQIPQAPSDLPVAPVELRIPIEITPAPTAPPAE